MRDPHTRESRGFGFVKMVTSDQADAAKNGLNGEVYEGRTLSIEKARRSKPRTPTPGKYFGPPKRGESNGPTTFVDQRSHQIEDRPPRRGGGGFRDRYDDRGYGGGRRDDYGGGYRSRDRYGGDRGGDRYDDRGYGGGRRDDYGGGRRDRDDYAPARGSSYRDDRSYGGREERRGGGSGGGYSYDRAPRGGAADAYAEPAAPAASGSRSAGGYADDRYERR